MLFLTLAVGLAGGWLGKTLRMPAGSFMGALAAVGALQIITGEAYFPEALRQTVQFCSGALIGCRITRKDLKEFRIIIVPTLLLILGMLVLNLAMGFAIHAFTDMDIVTALFSCTPGGMSDMALIAEALGAVTVVVAIMQLVRVIAVFLIMPPFLQWYSKKHPQPRRMDPAAQALASDTASPSAKATFFSGRMGDFALTMLVAAVGGLLCNYISIPAGALVGGMLAASALGVWKEKAFVPNKLRPTIQALAGAYVGLKLDSNSLQLLSTLILPAVIMTIMLIGFAFLIAYVMHKVTHMEFGACLLASCPAGVQEMALLSEELGYDTPKIAVMHTFRLFLVILTFPMLLSFITSLL